MTSSPSARPEKSHYRWAICAMLFWVTTANYIDRGVFGNLAPELQKTFHWTTSDYWYMTMGFQATYALSMIFWGRVVDVLGLRWGFTCAVALWGLAATGHALVTGITGFFLVRMLLGLAEGGNFPASIKTVAEWFPKRERALATGIFNSGSNVGGIVPPLLVGLAVPFFSHVRIAGHTLGWRGAFLCTGVFDLAWILAWVAIYRRPQEHPRVSAAELAIINSEPPENTVKIPWSRLLLYRQTWAFAVAKGMSDCMWWFYLFGAPSFLADRFHLNEQQREAPVSIIYLVTSVGSIGGGWLAGHLMKRGWSVNRARKITMLVFALCVVPVFFAALATNPWVAVGLITLAASAHQGWSANVFSLVGDMFPRRVVGSVVGLGGFVGSVGGVVFSYYVAQMLSGQGGGYLLVFAAPSLSYPLALLIVHLLVPRMEPAQVDAPEPVAA